MKTSMKSALLVVVLIIGSSTVLAGPQSKHHRGPGHGGMNPIVMLDRVVTLSEEQKQSIEQILEEEAAQFDPTARQKKAFLYELDPVSEDYQDQVDALAEAKAERVKQKILSRGRVHAKIHQVLTEEQRQAVKEFHQNKPKNGRGGRGRSWSSEV